MTSKMKNKYSPEVRAADMVVSSFFLLLAWQ